MLYSYVSTFSDSVRKRKKKRSSRTASQKILINLKNSTVSRLTALHLCACVMKK